MESWDDDNFEPPAVQPVLSSNKWEGEDEEEDVKESWEDEDEEKSEPLPPAEEVKPKVKKPTLAEKIAEKDRKRREEIEKRLKDEEEEKEMTAEEKLRMEKESDLKLALETTFEDHTNNTTAAGLDGLELPTTKEEFQDFTEALSKKLLLLSKSTEYPLFAENLLRSLCATMSSFDIKKIKNTLDNLYLEKQKLEKGDKTKKSRGKGKAKLKIDDGNSLSAYTNNYDDYDEFNEYDDFM